MCDIEVSVGFVLGQPEEGRIWGISITGFPSSGCYVSPGKPNRLFELSREGMTSSNYGAELGQGGLRSRYLSQDHTDPSLFQDELAGGFLIAPVGDWTCTERSCALDLARTSVLPFVISPDVEVDDTDNCASRDVKLFDSLPLADDVWYPVEIALADACNQHIPLPRPVIPTAYGVFKIEQRCHKMTGRIRFVSRSCEVFDANILLLYRFGRYVGSCKALSPGHGS